MTRLLPMLLFTGPLLAQTSTSTSTSSYSQTVHVSRSEQTNAIKTIGRTRRETLGPATVIVDALATEASPCTGYSGGLPVTNGGLSPDDGFLFKFTLPFTPIGCPWF